MQSFRLYQTVRVRPGAAPLGGSMEGIPAPGDVGNIVELPSPRVVTIECTDAAGGLRWLADLDAQYIEPVGPLPFRLVQKARFGASELLLADRLFEHTFTVSPGDRIAGCEVAESEIPRSLDEDGRQRLDRFGFVLAGGEESAASVGEIVYLVQS